MFVGHFAIALAAKRAAPSVSLGTLFLSCQLADLLWPNLVLIGVERLSIAPGITVVTPLNFESYPYSHSLMALSVWAVLAALLYKFVRRTPPAAAAAVVAALVLSHWVLDVVSHRPDMPITIGGETKIGLGLWNSRPATLVVELVMLAAGLAMYLRTTRPLDRTGQFALYGLVLFLLAINAANMLHSLATFAYQTGPVALSAADRWPMRRNYDVTEGTTSHSAHARNLHGRGPALR